MINIHSLAHVSLAFAPTAVSVSWDAELSVPKSGKFLASQKGWSPSLLTPSSLRWSVPELRGTVGLVQLIFSSQVTNTPAEDFLGAGAHPWSPGGTSLWRDHRWGRRQNGSQLRPTWGGWQPLTCANLTIRQPVLEAGTVESRPQPGAPFLNPRPRFNLVTGLCPPRSLILIPQPCPGRTQRPYHPVLRGGSCCGVTGFLPLASQLLRVSFNSDPGAFWVGVECLIPSPVNLTTVLEGCSQVRKLKPRAAKSLAEVHPAGLWLSQIWTWSIPRANLCGQKKS